MAVEWCADASNTKENQSMVSEAQCQQHGIVRKSTNLNEVFALRKTLEQAFSPLTILTDSLGVEHGLHRREVHCTSDKNPNADESKNIYHCGEKVAKLIIFELMLAIS